jgi:hypothetical protein
MSQISLHSWWIINSANKCNLSHIMTCMENLQLVHLTLHTSCNSQNGKLKGCETKKLFFYVALKSLKLSFLQVTTCTILQVLQILIFNCKRRITNFIRNRTSRYAWSGDRSGDLNNSRIESLSFGEYKLRAC